MGNKTAKRRLRTKPRASVAPDKPVALTLKVDSELYVRLSTLRATQRRTNQDILEQALKEYLTRAEHSGTR
jgi:Ribbon-helix-helix protein, copG family